MQTTKHRLRTVGLLLLIATILGSMLPPFFASPRHTGMSVAERQEFDRKQAQWETKFALVAGIALGASLALIIASFAIRAPREPEPTSGKQ